MAWYDDRAKTQFVGTYANEKQYQWDADSAAKRGWRLESVDDGSVHVIGEDPEQAKVRQKNRITATFVRDPDWMANREREIASAVQGEAAKSADNKEGRLVKADAELQRAEEQLRLRAAAAEAPVEANREQAERELLAALKEAVLRRKGALRAIEEAITAAQAAMAVGAAEFARSVAQHQQTREAWLVRLKAEEALLERQESVARIAKDWKTAWDRKRSAEEALRKRTGEFEARDNALQASLLPREEALRALRALDVVGGG